MPSSVSSSSRRIPQGHWLAALAAALVILVLVVGAMEFRLAARGFEPTIVDSPGRWIEQRARASALGEHALILLGNSRMQLDLDTASIRSETRMTPVQLAIDGSSFVPILAGLAKDPSIRGTVLIQYTDPPIAAGAIHDAAEEMQAAYDDAHIRIHLDYATSEAFLTDALHSHMRSYADGTRPITALLDRILATRPTPQYLVTLPDRSRAADYRKVTMPGWYFGRVIKNLGTEVRQPGMTDDELDTELQRRITAIVPEKAAHFDQGVDRIDAMVDAIQRRGGRVVFVVFPTSGLVRATDDARYPRARFWDRFVAHTTATTLHFDDAPGLRTFTCPDGSHLDMRDKARFTTALVKAIGLGQR